MTGVCVLGDRRTRHWSLLLGGLQQVHRAQAHAQWTGREIRFRGGGRLAGRQNQVEDLGGTDLEILGGSIIIQSSKGLIPLLLVRTFITREIGLQTGDKNLFSHLQVYAVVSMFFVTLSIGIFVLETHKLFQIDKNTNKPMWVRITALPRNQYIYIHFTFECQL